MHAFDRLESGLRSSQRMLLFIDPSSDAQAAGWPLRNYLAYLAARHSILRLRIICYRSTLEESMIGTVSLDSASAYDTEKPAAVGWEKNAAGKLAPKLADLGALMDPRRLADQAVDLNLKLMKWRILPALNLEKIKRTKCLLLGAGTLGCYVSRGLMAWGVQQITLVDSGKVSFSNPVRQPLFEFADCTNGGKAKAECAAEALRRIYPSIVSCAPFFITVADSALAASRGHPASDSDAWTPDPSCKRRGDQSCGRGIGKAYR